VEERPEAERIDPVAGELELLAERERDLLDTLGVARRIRVLRLDGRVQRLDRLERALLEPPVRREELARPLAQHLGLPLAQAPLDVVLARRELVERAGRPVLRDRLAEVAVEREAAADPTAAAVRPGEHAVGAPDLHGDEIVLPPELLEQARRDARRHDDAPAANELRAEHAVDVLRQARSRVGERLATQRGGEDRAEGDAAREQDRGARDQEDRRSVTERSTARRPRGVAAAAAKEVVLACAYRQRGREP